MNLLIRCILFNQQSTLFPWSDPAFRLLSILPGSLETVRKLGSFLCKCFAAAMHFTSRGYVAIVTDCLHDAGVCGLRLREIWSQLIPPLNFLKLFQSAPELSFHISTNVLDIQKILMDPQFFASKSLINGGIKEFEEGISPRNSFKHFNAAIKVGPARSEISERLQTFHIYFETPI